MNTLISATNLIAIIGALGTAIMGFITYKSQKKTDLKFKLDEIKRDAVSAFLGSIEELINHAAFTDSEEKFDQAAAIIKCKISLNKVYIYAPRNLVEALDDSLTAAIDLSNIVSEIPNSKIRDEDQVKKYQNESDELDRLFTNAVNIVRNEMGLYPEDVERTQLLILGKHTQN